MKISGIFALALFLATFNSFAGEEIIGGWKGISNPQKKDPPLSVMDIDFHKNKSNTTVGQYCYVTNYGNRTDCDPSEAENITNIKKISEHMYEADFVSFNDNVGGKVKIKIDNNKMFWVVTKYPKGDGYYGPQKYQLDKKK